MFYFNVGFDSFPDLLRYLLIQLSKPIIYEFSMEHFPPMEQYNRLVDIRYIGNRLPSDCRAYSQLLGLR